VVPVPVGQEEPQCGEEQEGREGYMKTGETEQKQFERERKLEKKIYQQRHISGSSSIHGPNYDNNLTN
jgi:hypothetical protein